MHVLASDQETFIILIPKDLSHEDRMDTMREIKSFLLTYNKIYHFLKVGFYQVEVSFNKLIGTLLKIIYIEELDFGGNKIDLRIVISEEELLGIEVEDVIVGSTYYLYHNKLYLKEEDLTLATFLQLVEHARIVLSEEMRQVLKYGKKVLIPKKVL